MRRNFHRRVRTACGCPADEQGQLEPLALHLAGYMDHLVERGRDQAAEPDHVSTLLFGAFQNFFAGHHYAEIDDVVVVACQDHADDVLADVVHVAFDRGQQNLPPRLNRLTGRGPLCLLGLHEGGQMGYGLLHHPR